MRQRGRTRLTARNSVAPARTEHNLTAPVARRRTRRWPSSRCWGQRRSVAPSTRYGSHRRPARSPERRCAGTPESPEVRATRRRRWSSEVRRHCKRVRDPGSRGRSFGCAAGQEALPECEQALEREGSVVRVLDARVVPRVQKRHVVVHVAVQVHPARREGAHRQVRQHHWRIAVDRQDSGATPCSAVSSNRASRIRTPMRSAQSDTPPGPCTEWVAPLPRRSRPIPPRPSSGDPAGAALPAVLDADMAAGARRHPTDHVGFWILFPGSDVIYTGRAPASSHLSRLR